MTYWKNINFDHALADQISQREFKDLPWYIKKIKESQVRIDIFESQYEGDTRVKPLLPNNLSRNDLEYLDQLRAVFNGYEAIEPKFSKFDQEIYNTLKMDIFPGFCFDTRIQNFNIQLVLEKYFGKRMKPEATDYVVNITSSFWETISSFQSQNLLVGPVSCQILGLLCANYMATSIFFNYPLSMLGDIVSLHRYLVDSFEVVTRLGASGFNFYTDVDLSTLPSLSDLFSQAKMSMLDMLHQNRCIIKKLPIIGNLLFILMEAICKPEIPLSLGNFMAGNVDYIIKHSVALTNYFHLTNIDNFIDVHENMPVNHKTPTPVIGSPKAVIITKMVMGGLVLTAIIKGIMKCFS